MNSQHLGKGYGSIVCRAMTKKLGDLGQDVFACIGEHNTPSIRTFVNAGYKAIDTTCWLRTCPTIPFQWTDDEDE